MDGISPQTGANQHAVLEVGTPWLESINYRAGMSVHRKPPAKPTIFRVHPDLLRANRSAYEPKMVSIGPYNRRKSEDLKAMEELKWRLLHHYLSIVPNGSKNEGLRKMKILEKQCRDCYSEVIDLCSDQFVEMLLLDGCFLVQIFIADDDEELGEEELKSLLQNNDWFADLMSHDLLLLENQLPYFIVEHLLNTLEMPGWNLSRLQAAAISWFSYPPGDSNGRDLQLPGQRFPDVDHLLHLLHKWILSLQKSDKVLPRRSHSSPSYKFLKIVPSVTELAEAGVKIKERKANSFLDISFSKNKGLLEIPTIHVDDDTSFVLSNLIALEQSCSRHGTVVTDYSLFLDDIINTQRDVELLHQEGIIQRYLGADEDIASLFNKIGNGVSFDLAESYLKDVYEDLNAYCQSRWHRWRARAMRDYFNNPWAIISLGAAVLLLGLTILQSVYAVLGYYKN